MRDRIIREPVVAGAFYPADPSKLSRQIEKLLRSVTPVKEPRPYQIGAVVPHAGYRYSGPVAAYSYSAISSYNPKDVILVGPSHREYFLGCSVFNGDAVKTPLGEVPVNNSLVEKLVHSDDSVNAGQQGHSAEHALEVQLPFLQSIYNHKFTVTLITMGDQSRKTVQTLARALKSIWKQEILVLASSDLSHYYSYDKAVAMDSTFGNLVERYDIQGLWRAMERHEVEACGFGPVMTLLKLGEYLGNKESEIYRYMNSGDVTGDRKQVVGYLAAGVYAHTP